MAFTDSIDRTTPSNWIIQTNDGSNVVAINTSTKETYSGSLIGFNNLLKQNNPIFDVAHANPVVLIDPITGQPYSATGAGGGGGSGVDRELVVTTYAAKNTFFNASAGDLITSTQIIDVSSSTPITVGTIWRNQSTGVDFSTPPDASNLTLTGGNTATEPTLQSVRDRLPSSGTASEATLSNLLTAQNNLSTRVGALDESVASSDTSNSGINGLLKRIAQRLTTLIGLFPGPLSRTVMLNAVTTTQSGAAFADNGRPPSFVATVSGTGSLTAIVEIQARNAVSGSWITLATISLTGSSSSLSDGFACMTRYLEYRAVLTNISGTSATVTVIMGS